MDEDDGGTYTLDAYVNRIRNTVYAAYEDHDETDVHERLEGLLYEFRDEYDPQIDSREAFADELDALVRDAYIPADQIVEVLTEKREELEELGSADSNVDRLIEEAPDPDPDEPPEEGPVDRLLDEDT